MSHWQLPKLCPDIGGGLSRLSAAAAVCSTAKSVSTPEIIGVNNPISVGSFTSAGSSSYLCPPLVFGNKVYSLQSPATGFAEGYLYTYNEVTKTFTMGSTLYTSPIAYNYTQRVTFPVFDTYCYIFYNFNTPTLLKLNIDDTLSIVELSTYIPLNGTYSNSTAYSGINNIGYMKKIGNLLYILAFNSTTPTTNGMFIFDSSMTLMSSYGINISANTTPLFMFTETPYGFCVCSAPTQTTNATYPLYLKTFDFNFSLISSVNQSKTYSGALVANTDSLCKTSDGNGIGVIVKNMNAGYVQSYSGTAPEISSTGIISALTFGSESSTNSSDYTTFTGVLSYKVPTFEILGYTTRSNAATMFFPFFKQFVKTTIKNINPTGLVPNIVEKSINNATSYSDNTIGLMVPFKDNKFLTHGRFGNASSNVTLYVCDIVYN